MSTLPSLPLLDQAPAPAAFFSQLPMAALTLNARKFVADGGHSYRIDVPSRFFARLPKHDGEVACAVLENNQVLGPQPALHDVIRHVGRGHVSVYHEARAGTVRVYLSTSDNSDPRSNRRSYAVLNQPIAFWNDWPYRRQRGWLNHSRGLYFLRRGGDKIPPPVAANMGITDICNLRCSICGSQNMEQPVNRRHMDFRIFQQVADTLFPLLHIVEFNSRGEPLLHPRVADMLEIVNDYDIFFRMQTNGTQFSDHKVRLLSKMQGELSISLDATGELFEYARKLGRWANVDAGVHNLLRQRDRSRLSVRLYPTLTAKTIQGARELLAWSMEVGIDRIDFHNYNPIQRCSESPPTPEQIQDLERTVAKLPASHPLGVCLNHRSIKDGQAPFRYPEAIKYSNIPRRPDDVGAHPTYSCAAPLQLVDIDLDGGVCVCCMMQERKLGNALTPEAFADCWFGDEYRACRDSLKRTSSPLYETCRHCITYHTAAQPLAA